MATGAGRDGALRDQHFAQADLQNMPALRGRPAEQGPDFGGDRNRDHSRRRRRSDAGEKNPRLCWYRGEGAACFDCFFFSLSIAFYYCLRLMSWALIVLVWFLGSSISGAVLFR